ncbi:MAG: hypothetical protein K1X82_13605 [Bacteroidia bacterium]|nr:hypothetical protein [Bacteroidia bacterium]
MDVVQDKEVVSLSNPHLITKNGNYDNQPYFTANSTGLLYVSEQTNSQTDVFYFDFSTNASTPITNTPESEYSAKGSSLQQFTCVRVDSDSAQRLYQYNQAVPKQIFTKSDSMGYYSLVDSKCIFFKITEPASIWLADSLSEKQLSGIPGRCFVSNPAGTEAWFTQKLGDGFLLMYYKNKNIGISINLPDKAEFFDYWDANHLLINTGSKLILLNWSTGTKIDIPFPTTLPAFTKTRLSISPDHKHLALVVAEQ